MRADKPRIMSAVGSASAERTNYSFWTHWFILVAIHKRQQQPRVRRRKRIQHAWTPTFPLLFIEIGWLLFSPWSFSCFTAWHRRFFATSVLNRQVFLSVISFPWVLLLQPHARLSGKWRLAAWVAFVCLPFSGTWERKADVLCGVKDKRTHHCLVTLWFRENLCKIPFILFLRCNLKKPNNPWTMQNCQLSDMETKSCCRLLVINEI